MVIIKKQRRHSRGGGGGYSYYSRHGGGSPHMSLGSKGSTLIPMIVGALIGFVGDMAYGSLGLPGYDSKAPKCEAFSNGDVVQLSALTGVTLLAFATRNWLFVSAAFGMTAGSLLPKLLAASGMPRYIIFNLDPSQGTISPLGNGGLRGVYSAISGKPTPQQTANDTTALKKGTAGL